ncbi:Uncharacterized protein APZ42_028428 [Daphnia magna]|uniref:Uncharacterized protein n=1 Tax=Daphnia magna TaxID=35525 RepID=A0A164QJ53_9CRUS|nr:Uncharacterized protein APZ42_028428 [Daphnia magna]
MIPAFLRRTTYIDGERPHSQQIMPEIQVFFWTRGPHSDREVPDRVWPGRHKIPETVCSSGKTIDRGYPTNQEVKLVYQWGTVSLTNVQTGRTSFQVKRHLAVSTYLLQT